MFFLEIPRKLDAVDDNELVALAALDDAKAEIAIVLCKSDGCIRHDNTSRQRRPTSRPCQRDRLAGHLPSTRRRVCRTLTEQLMYARHDSSSRSLRPEATRRLKFRGLSRPFWNGL